VVPYLNIATHLEGVPYDRLLQEKGFGGYPSLAFMDAEGNVIGKPNDRTVASFASSRDALMSIDSVRAKAESGDKNAQVELLFLEFTLGNIKAEELTQAVEALAVHASAKQLARAKQVGLDARIYDLYVASFNDPNSGSSEKMIAMLQAGELPTPGSRSCSVFWSSIGAQAQKSGDTALLRRVSKGMRADLASDKQSQEMATNYERIATGLDERDTLVERQDSGEANLDAKILLLEARLDAVSLTSFRERLAAALVVASANEQIELLQADIDLEVNTLMVSYWSDGDKEAIQVQLFTLFENHEPAPSESLLGLISYPIYNFTRSVTDPKVLDDHAAAMNKRYGPESGINKLIKTMTDAASALREA
jgi:hypothetical protein